MRNGRGVISDSMGYFKIRLKPRDTLMFECLGFENNYFTLPDTLESNVCFFEVKLSPTSYHLKVIDVLALSRQSQFRQDFINMEPDNSAWEKQLIIPGVTKENYQFIKEEEKFNPRQTFNGPFSALYYKYSKEGKSLQKLATLLEEDEKEEVIQNKFNKSLVKSFTGYTGDTLNTFYRYLDFSIDYLYKTNAYRIFVEVQNKKLIFEKELEMNRVKIGEIFD